MIKKIIFYFLLLKKIEYFQIIFLIIFHCFYFYFLRVILLLLLLLLFNFFFSKKYKLLWKIVTNSSTPKWNLNFSYVCIIHHSSLRWIWNVMKICKHLCGKYRGSRSGNVISGSASNWNTPCTSKTLPHSISSTQDTHLPNPLSFSF